MKDCYKKIAAKIFQNPLFWVLIIIGILIGFITFFERGYPGYIKGMYNIF